MGLAANVARRGGVYWWRGRIGPGQPLPRVIAKSLRTRDPAIARVLGAQITGVAAQLRQQVRCGMMTTDQAEAEIEAFLAKFPFEVDPEVLERQDPDRAPRINRIEPHSLTYSAEQEFAMLADFARRMGPILDRRAAEVRTRPLLFLNGIAADWVAEAVRNDRNLAEACRLLAILGTSARIRPYIRAALVEAGFDDEEVKRSAVYSSNTRSARQNLTG